MVNKLVGPTEDWADILIESTTVNPELICIEHQTHTGCSNLLEDSYL